MNQTTQAETAGSDYKNLYRLGGVAALIVVGVTVLEVIGFIIYPQPGTISDWFALFQRNKFIGLFDFWGLEVVMYAMFTLVFLALYMVLREANKDLMIIATIFALLGLGSFSQQTILSPCFLSATNMQRRQPTHREQLSWQQGRQSWPIQVNALWVGSIWACFWYLLQV